MDLGAGKAERDPAPRPRIGPHVEVRDTRGAGQRRPMPDRRPRTPRRTRRGPQVAGRRRGGRRPRARRAHSESPRRPPSRRNSGRGGGRDPRCRLGLPTVRHRIGGAAPAAGRGTCGQPCRPGPWTCRPAPTGRRAHRRRAASPAVTVVGGGHIEASGEHGELPGTPGSFFVVEQSQLQSSAPAASCAARLARGVPPSGRQGAHRAEKRVLLVAACTRAAASSMASGIPPSRSQICSTDVAGRLGRTRRRCGPDR